MAKPKNSGEPWTNSEIQQIRKAVADNQPTTKIAKGLGRSVAAVQKEASNKNISLIPKNR